MPERMSAMDTIPAEPAPDIMDTARMLVMVLRLVHMDPPTGCVCLAEAYALWLEREPEMTAEWLERSIALSNQTTRETFRILRKMREDITDAFPQA